MLIFEKEISVGFVSVPAAISRVPRPSKTRLPPDDEIVDVIDSSSAASSGS